MAGTSLDGVDAAVVRFATEAGPELLAARTTPYEASLVAAIRAAGAETPLREIAALDARLADVFARAAEAVIDEAAIDRAEVRAVASHGQTVWHHPQPPCQTSIQLGDPNRIAEHCELDVVADFRRRDIAAGGQGAPLAPLFHDALFRASEPRAVLNLGGIGNVTLLPADANASGFDTGPANTLLDAWYRSHYDGTFDADGAWAAAGRVDHDLLAHLMADAFFDTPPPRSTGPEHFNLAWLDAALAGRSLQPVDVQATLAELTARSAARAIQQQLPSAARVIVCGGGAHNADVMRRLATQLPGIAVESSAAHGIPPDWIEALGFAWLGRETLEGRPGNATAVTGARHQRVLGGIYRGA